MQIHKGGQLREPHVKNPVPIRNFSWEHTITVPQQLPKSQTAIQETNIDMTTNHSRIDTVPPTPLTPSPVEKFLLTD